MGVNMKQVSFVIPCYNSQAYLKQCLDSFLVDAVLPSIEVIVVNDGSTDSTSQIAHDYEKKYPEVFRVLDKPNGGHGSGINAGITLAQGRYFKVVDSDDWIVRENLVRFVKSLKDTAADVVLNSYQTIDLKCGAVLPFSLPEDLAGKVISISTLITRYNEVRDCCTFHGVTYSTQLLRKYGHKLAEGVFYEDQEYATIYFHRAKSVLILPFYLYQYRVGNENQSISISNQVRNISHIQVVAERIIQYWNQFPDMDSNVNEYFIQKMAVLVTSYFATALVKNPEKKEGRKLARNFYEYLMENKPILLERTTRKRTMLGILNRLSFSPELYQKLLYSSLYKKFRGKWLQ